MFVGGPIEIAQLAASADHLDSAEDFLDPLTPSLALAVTVMPRGPAIDRAAPPAITLDKVRGDAERPRVPDEVAVGAQRGRSANAALQHLQRRLVLGVTVGLAQFDIDDQAISVLSQHVSEIAESRLLLLALAVEPCLGNGGRGVRLATAALAR